MNAIAQAAPGVASRRARALLAPSTPSADARWRLLVYLLCVLGGVAWTLAAGKDVNWDTLNYHVYSGFSALHDRFGLDYFAAGTPAYLHPYAHVPLYVMMAAGLPDVAIGIVLALMHATNLWFTYEIALTLARVADGRSIPTVGAVALVVAAMNPVMLQAFGSTFADPTTGAFALAGWWMLARAFHGVPIRHAAAAGALLGIATGLKLTNAPFAIAGAVVVLFLPGGWSAVSRAGVAFCIACGAGFVAVSAPWSWQLWSEFRNPFFPLFNSVFRSPDFITDPVRYERFLPASWWEALVRPFAIAVPKRMIHIESRAPDLRYAALVVLIVAWGGATWYRRGRPATTPSAAPMAVQDRLLLAFLSGFAVAWALWLATSANSRYFLPMASVSAALIAVLLVRIAPREGRVLFYATLAFVLLQGLQLVMVAHGRWASQPWEGPFLRVEVPNRFRSEPYFYISPIAQSGSFFAPSLAPGSGMMNISGFYPLDPQRPGGAKAVAMIERNLSHLRSLVALRTMRADGTPVPPTQTDHDNFFLRFGLRGAPDDCAYFRVRGGLEVTVVDGQAAGAVSGKPEWNYFLTCRLVPSAEGLAAYHAKRAEIDVVLDHIEDACPNLFHPPRMLTELRGSWGRSYGMGSDMVLWINDGWIKYYSPTRGGDPIVLGRESDWRAGPQPVDCSRRHNPAFGLPERSIE